MFAFLKGFSLFMVRFLHPTGSPILLFGGKILIDNIGDPYHRRINDSIYTNAWMRVYPHINMWQFGIGFKIDWVLHPQIDIRFLFFHLNITFYSMYWNLTKEQRSMQNPVISSKRK